MLTEVSETVSCPLCSRSLLQAFQAKLAFPVNPLMHKCRDCRVVLFSWVMCVSAHENGTRIIPLNPREDEHLLSRLRTFRVFDYLELMVVTEDKLRRHTRDFKESSFEAILKMYELQKKEPILN